MANKIPGFLSVIIRDAEGNLVHRSAALVDDVATAIEDHLSTYGDSLVPDDLDAPASEGAQPLGSAAANAASSDSSTEGAQPTDAASSTDGSSTPPAAKKRTARKSTKRQR